MMLGVLGFVVHCGRGLGPVAHSRRDLDRLSAEATWIRARGITDEDISALDRFQYLRGLDLYSGFPAVPQRVSEQGFAVLERLQLPRLRTVTIACSSLLTDDAVTSISRIESVRHVALTRCGPFGEKGLAALAKVHRVEGLDLGGCSQVGDECVDELASMKALRHLVIAGTGISDQGVRSLREALEHAVIESDHERFLRDDPTSKYTGCDR